jgi:hypothetical protein
MEKYNWNAYGFLWRKGNEKVKQKSKPFIGVYV